MGSDWRVIENEDDGTSPYRARIVKGKRNAVTLVALFMDLGECNQALAAVKYVHKTGNKIKAI